MVYNSNMAAPITQYKHVYSTKRVGEYLDTCRDEEVKTLVQENTDKGYAMYKTTLKIHLPTIEGYAKFLNHGTRTLFDWAKQNKEFRKALDKILEAQKEKLINSSLDGTYNTTISKFLLSNNHGMRDNSDITTNGETLNTFNDDQINKIAERIARRRAPNGDTSVTEESN